MADKLTTSKQSEAKEAKQADTQAKVDEVVASTADADEIIAANGGKFDPPQVPSDPSPPAIENQGDIVNAPEPKETAKLLDQQDGNDKPAEAEQRPQDSPPNAQQTEPPGVIAGETAAMMAGKYVEGVHRHDENVGVAHAGPILVDSSKDKDTPNDVEKQ
jgi:hypothetical protein